MRGTSAGPAALVFPLTTALGGTLLLTHSHAIANIKDELLIEMSHTPLALCGVAAGWARWLELRLDGRSAKSLPGSGMWPSSWSGSSCWTTAKPDLRARRREASALPYWRFAGAARVGPPCVGTHPDDLALFIIPC
jgi:hypothetical protein